MKKPLILEIKGNSLDDGPGIRSVVFFKGCPLSCIWCHNPESKKKSVEISFDPNECVGCQACITACPDMALSKENAFFVDRNLCSLCFNCVEHCPSGALGQVGKEMSADDIVEQVMKDKPFYDTSKGGVTFSGGEPTLNIDFLAAVAKSLKEKGVHVLVETCGQFNCDQFIEHLYPYVDLIYFDIKIFDSNNHKKYCGLPNNKIFENFTKLHKMYLDGGVEIMPRTPLIPGITDTKENLDNIIAFYHKENVTKTHLMAYHPLWQDKNLKIGIASSSTDETNLGEWMGNEQVSRCKKRFADAGIILEP